MEPITTALILSTITNTVINAGQRFAEKRIDERTDGFWGLCRKRIAKLWDKGEPPKNAHLFKAVNNAHIKATTCLIKAVGTELKALGQTDEAEQLDLYFKVWLKEAAIIEEKDTDNFNHDSPIYQQIEVLLAAAKSSKEPDAQTIRNEVAAVCKQKLLNSLPYEMQTIAAGKGQKGYEFPTEVLNGLLENGWEYNNKTIDWFDVLTLEFGDILKNKEHAKVAEAFKDRLLSDVKIDTKTILTTLEEGVTNSDLIIEQLKTANDYLISIDVKLDEVLKIITLIIEKVKQILANQEITHANQDEIKDMIGEVLKNQKQDVQLSLISSDEVNQLLEQQIGLKQTDNATKLKEVTKKLKEIRENAERLNEIFKNVDSDKASKRFKQAQKLFEQGAYDKVRKLLEEEEREKEIEKLFSDKNKLEQRSKNYADEELVLAQSILMDVEDPKRFTKAVAAFEQSIAIYPSDNNHFEYGYYLAKQNKQHEAITQYKHALSFLNEEDKNQYRKSIILNNLGNLYRQNNDSVNATKAFNEALAYYRSLAEKNPDAYLPYLATTLNNLGTLYADNNDSVNATQAYNEALAYYRSLAETNPDVYLPYLATTLNNLGTLYADNNDSVNATQAYTEALTIRRGLAEKNPDAYLHDVATTLNNLGALYADNNDSVNATQAYNEALTYYRRLAEKNPDAYLPDVTMTLNNLGILYRQNNDSVNATQAYTEALNIRRGLAEKNPDAYLPDVATTLNNLGNLYRQNNDSVNATQAYNEALNIRRSLAEKNPDAYLHDVATTLNNLGALYADNNDSVNATQAYNEALTYYRRLAEKNPDAYLPDVTMTLNNLGILYTNNNDSVNATKAYTEALTIRRGLAEKNPDAYLPDVAMTAAPLGILYKAIDEKEKAKTLLEEALSIFEDFAQRNPSRYQPYVAIVKQELESL